MKKKEEEKKDVSTSISIAKTRRQKFKAPNRMPTRRVIEKEEVKSDKIENTFLSASFPLIIIVILLILFGVFYYLFNNYEKVIMIDNDGFFLTNDNRTLLLGSKKKDEINTINTLSVKENETIYKTSFNYTIENDKKKTINLTYPLFINNGLTIVNYNENVNLINNNFERIIGYNGLVLTYGKAYDVTEYIQIDKENYLLMSYKDGVNINLYDLKIKTTLHEYSIPINSFIYFEQDSISYYERDNNSFKYKTINDIDYESILTFYYNGGKEEYEYNYESFLEGIGTIYITPDPIPDPGEEIKPGENEEEKPDPKPDIPNKPSDSNKPEFVYVKPSVNIGSFTVNVYSMKNNITITDPAGVIVKAPTFTLYSGGRIYLNRTFYSSGDMTISGLIPSTEFTIVGKYTYLDEDMETKKIVTFFVKTVKTKELTTLDPIELSFENGLVYPKKIEINDVKVISDLTSEAIMGVNKIALSIGDTNYYLGASDVTKIINGIETKVSTSESLKSSQIIDYKFTFFDRVGNEIRSIKNTGQTRTSKRAPTVTLRVKTNKVDNVEIGINLRNEDNIDLTDYKYTLTNTSGKILSQGKVDGNSLVLSGLSPDQLFNITISADLDIDDGQGLHNDYVLSSMEFTTKPIASLGYANINIKNNEMTYNSAEYIFSVNIRKTDAILLRLISDISVCAYDASDNTLVEKIEYTGEDIEKFKNKEELVAKFKNLKSNTKYNLVIKTTIKQGEETYVLDCVYNILDFITNKTPAKINVTNSFTTETMLDFDLNVIDPDEAIISDYIRVELRDKDNNILDIKTVNKDEVSRITYNNLNVNEFYTVNFYADEYNETTLNENFKYKYLISTYRVYTDEGISGKIELVSSLREPTGSNLADVKSEVKWIQTEQYYNIPKTIDEDGDLHIYSKSGGAAYTYDLSEYHGQIVTISFKAKTINNSNNYKLYFTQYIPGTSSNGYSKEVVGVNTDTWTEFSYTFKVGALSYTDSKWFNHYSTMSYGKNLNDSAGFYINGGNSELTEFEIRDLDIHVQYDKTYVDTSNIQLEKGYYNSNGTKNDSNNNFYVRASDTIALEGGHFYSIDFDNPSTYQFYIYIYKPNGQLEKGWGYYGTGATFYVQEDRYIKLFFRYQNGQAELKPEDINNLRVYKYSNNNLSSNPEFTYELETKVKINLTDSRDEISDDNYFITIYDEYNNELLNQEYKDLVNNNILNDIIKKISLEESKNYLIALRIKIRDRYYTLSTFEITTDDETYSISNSNDWRYIQPYGKYIVLNDIDFTDYLDQRLGWGYRYFHGTIDFQGYKMIVYSSKSTDDSPLTQFRRINRIEKDAIIKNLVLEFNINNKSINNSLSGVFGDNYGTIENVMINIKDTHNKNTAQLYTSALVNTNAVTGIIRNFVVNLETDVYYYSDSGIISRYNYGTIENGYIHGKDIIVEFTNGGNPTRSVGMLFRYGGVKSKVNRVYSLSSIKFINNQSNDIGGIFGYETYGIVENSYVVGDTNPKQPSRGPVIAYPQATSRFNNIYYISDNIYTFASQQKASLVSVTDKQFQNDILGSGFNVDELIELGYYPQVNFSSTKMPVQEYIDLPEISEDDYADIISMKVIEKTNNSALVSVNVNNILGEEVTSILISNVKTEIQSQTYSDGKSTVILKVSNPDLYTSRYQVRSISTRSVTGYTSTRKYSADEKYLIVDFYKEVYSVEDFININNGLSQNYAIMDDLDFEGYVKFHINNFSGKLEGNNHTLKNIELTLAGKNGLFNQMNGSLQNITFDNIYIKTTSSSQLGIVGYSNQYSSYYNVHVKNIEIEIPDTMTRENVYVGGLIANSYASKIDYCSVSNIKITSTANIFGITIGGLIGYSNASIITNTFVNNVDATIENASGSNGLGGLIGREVSSNGIISNTYTTGKLSTNSLYIGGICGNLQGNIENSYSSINLSSDMYYVGGIAGYSRTSTDTVKNCLYLGNIYSSSSDSTINRIVGNYVSDASNYAMSSSLINGVSSDKTNGENLVSYNDLLKEETYKIILNDSEEFDYSKSSDAIMPLLYSIDKESLLVNQTETKLFKNIFNINNFVIDKHADYADITMYLDNPQSLRITDIEVESARIEIVRNVNTDDLTVFEFKLYPVQYHDNYKISNIYYEDIEGNTLKVEKNYRVDAIFYKYLSSFEDWQKISKTDPENYLLTNNINFAGRDKVNTDVVINRLETAGEDINYSLYGFDINVTKAKNYTNIISRIVTSFKNITIKDTTITDMTTSGNNYSNIILFNYGTLSNLRFENITINTPKKNYVGILGSNYGQYIDDITLEKIYMTGNRNVSGFITYTQSSIDNKFENINAKDIHVNATGVYSGGLIAQFSGGVSSGENPIYTNMNISSSEIISTSYNVGGLIGYGDVSHAVVDDVYVKGLYNVGGAIGGTASPEYDITVKNSTIEGTSYYVGGVFGSANNVYDVSLQESEVNGLTANTHSVGGIFGSQGWGTTGRVSVINSTISNSGYYTGGIGGYQSGGTIVSSFITDSVVSGNDYTGGLVGRITYPNIYDNRVISTIINSTNEYSGGLVGLYDNIDYQYNEGYLRECNVEKSTIKASSYAGSFIGKSTNDFFFAGRIRRLYSDSEVITEDDNNYGIAIGDDHDSDLLKSPDIYLYENAIANGVKVSQSATIIEYGADILSTVTIHNGTVNGSGVATENVTQTNSQYTDFIDLEKGKSYEINIIQGKISNTFDVYLYDVNGKFISRINSGTSEQYIDQAHDLSYINNIKFNVYKDCKIRITFTNISSIIDRTLKEVKSSSPINKSMLLSTNDLRLRATWTHHLYGSTYIRSDQSKLKYSPSYWDFDVINKNIPESVSIEDLSNNNHNLTAHVTSITKEGINFDGNDDYSEISNYSLPTDGNYTFQMTFQPLINRGYQYLFSSRNHTANNNGFGVFLNYGTIHVWIYNTNYSTGIVPPINEKSTITITYENNKYLKAYLNGELYYSGTINKQLVNNSSTKTYLANDLQYSSNSYRFSGLIENVMTYNRVLSENEIKNNYSSSSGITNTNNLTLYYDFTNIEQNYESYYPIVKWNTTAYEVKNQPLTTLPSGIETTYLIGMSALSINSLYSDIPNYYIYPSGIDTINIEFDEIAKDMSIIYKINGIEYKTNVEKKTYTLAYDYESDASITISNAFETKTIDLNKDDLSKQIAIFNNNYYNIEDNTLYENNKSIIKDALHIYNNLVLLKNNKTYDILTKEINNIISNNGILNSEIPLYRSSIEDKIINTYYKYTLVNDEIKDGQILLNNNIMYVFNTKDTKNDNIIFNNYNNLEYQIVLTNDGKIEAYKESIIYPNSFVNANIKQISFDKNTTEPLIIVKYESGNVIVFNYVNGNKIFEFGKNMNATLFEFVSSKFSRSSVISSISRKSYQESKELLNELNNISDNEVITKLDNYVISDNNIGNKLNNKYVSIYNSVTNEYEIYNSSEILSTSTNKNNNIQDDDIIIDIDNPKEDTNTKSINNKLKSDMFLYNYFYNEKNTKSIVDKKVWIYSILLIAIMINLIILSVKYGNKEATRDEK
ncbi:MAG: LamG-like jellyroll fold domain-containing protein [Bacilli bacterium]